MSSLWWTLRIGPVVSVVVVIGLGWFFQGTLRLVPNDRARGPVALVGWITLVLLALALVALHLCLVRLRRSSRTPKDDNKFGQYTLVEKIGSGGMGIVYRARHALLNRPTAVKILEVDKTNEENAARFEREVQLTSQLHHPNTIAVYDYGRTPHGVFYYAMEYLDGITLENIIKSYGPLPESRVIHILTQLCGSLAEAHDIGVIHRDIKPANIMLNRLGGMYDFVKLLDFGLVKVIDGKEELRLTQGKSIKGTPLYLSPEAIETPQTIDRRADLYSLAAVGYFLLTGKPVFEGQSFFELCIQHIRRKPKPPSEKLGRPVSSDLEAVILRCLSKKRDERPADARELEKELLSCKSAGQWTQEAAASWWEIVRKIGPRERKKVPDDNPNEVFTVSHNDVET